MKPPPAVEARISQFWQSAWHCRNLEGVAVAAPLPRWLASVLDALILLLAHLIILAPFLYFVPDPFASLRWVARLSPLACWIYLWVGWTRGQTIGQRVLRIRIVTADGDPMTAGRALRRLFGYALVCASFKIGLLPILLDPLRRGWHDRLAGTLVVEAHSPAPDTLALRAVTREAQGREAKFATTIPAPIAPDFSVARRYWPLVFAFYLALSIALTWPVAPQWRTALAGDGGDGWVFVWNYWYFGHALQTGAPLTSTNLLFHPFQVPLLFHTMNWFNCVLAWPLLQFFSPTETYNLLFLLTPAWCAFSVYWLACSISKSRLASVVVAPVFGFSPYFMAHGLGHANLTSAQMLPIFAGLFYASLLTGRARYALGASVALALAGLCDWQYLLFGGVIAVGLWAAIEWQMWRMGRQLSARRLALTLATLGLGATLISPLLVPLLRANRQASYMDKSRQAGGFSVRTDDWTRAGKLHPILSAPRDMNASNETNVAPGWTMLILCILSLCWCRWPLRPWLALASIAGVLACGPYLFGDWNTPLLLLGLGAPGNGLSPPWHTDELFGLATQLAINPVPLNFSFVTEMPFNWLAPHVPMLKAFRVPARLAVIVLMCCAPIAATGLAHLIQRLRPTGLRALIAIGVACAILFEYLAWPYPTSDSHVPTFYQRIARDPDNYAVADVPIITWPRAMGWQTAHGKPILLGNIARCPPEAFALVVHNDLLRALSAVDYELPGEKLAQIPDADFNYQPAIRELRSANVRYLVLHKAKLTGPSSARIGRVLNSLPVPIIFEDATMRVYDLR